MARGGALRGQEDLEVRLPRRGSLPAHPNVAGLAMSRTVSASYIEAARWEDRYARRVLPWVYLTFSRGSLKTNGWMGPFHA